MGEEKRERETGFAVEEVGGLKYAGQPSVRERYMPKPLRGGCCAYGGFLPLDLRPNNAVQGILVVTICGADVKNKAILGIKMALCKIKSHLKKSPMLLFLSNHLIFYIVSCH